MLTQKISFVATVLCGLALGSIGRPPLLAAPSAGAEPNVAPCAQVDTDLTPSRALSEMARAAGSVVVGRIAEVRVAPHPRYRRLTVTTVRVQVADTWKGAPGRTLTFTQFGDASTGPPAVATEGKTVIARFPDMPTYAVGEEILLFLRRPSHAGLTSPVGGLTGKLAIRRDVTAGRASTQSGLADSTLVASPAGSRGGWISLKSARAIVTGAARQEGQ
jgi:hypothetical protein